MKSLRFMLCSLLSVTLILVSETVTLAQAKSVEIVQHPFDASGPGAFSNLEPGSHQQIADDFQLSATTLLDSISWFGQYGAIERQKKTAFAVRFFADNGGVPAVSPLAEFNVKPRLKKTRLTLNGIPWVSYSAHLDVTLSPGMYWVSIVESDPKTPAIGSSQWLWGQSQAGLRAYRASDDSTWNQDVHIDMAFSITGTVSPKTK